VLIATSLSGSKIRHLHSNTAQRSRSKSPPRGLMESHSEDEGKKLPAESTDLEFITFTDFNQTTHRETKKRVRSHVMRRVQRNLRSEKRKENEGEIVLDLSLLSQVNTGPSQDPSISMLAPAVVPRPYDLGAGRSDPFVKYPIDMDVRTHELFDHCKDYL
jgi:hypothetical protein